MISIRKVGLQDVEVLQGIARDTFFEAFADSNSEEDMQHYLLVNFSLDKLSAELAQISSQFFIAFDGDAPVGYLKVNSGEAQTDLQEDHSLEIERIYVMGAYHGKKVGQLLYEQALEVAVSLGKSSVWLGVWEHNLKAIRFYEKNGFVPFSTHIFKMGNDEQTDIMMRKEIITK